MVYCRAADQTRHAFLICFAFGLDGGETDEFFRRYYARAQLQLPSGQEAVYYFCLNNGLSYAEALDIQTHVPLAKESRRVVTLCIPVLS